MHELSIALSVVDTACEELARHPGERATAVHLKLGPLSGVAKDALLFSFDLACQGTPIEGAQLLIQDIPVRIYCEPCQAAREPASDHGVVCPDCGIPANKILQGNELEIAALELCGVEAFA